MYSEAIESSARQTYLLAAPLPPAPRHPIKSQERGVKARRKPTRALSSRVSHVVYIVGLGGSEGLGVHRSRVSEGVSQLTLDVVVGRQVKLLEELRAHGHAGGRAELLESLHAVGLSIVAIGLVEFGVLGGGHCEVMSRESSEK